jgi:SAM-dependent methyltransferase
MPRPCSGSAKRELTAQGLPCVPVTVRYGAWRNGEPALRAFVEEWATSHPRARICEIGAGANPVLGADTVTVHDYVVIDIDAGELAKCRAGISRVQADIAAPDFTPPGQYDLVISNTLAEHVSDGAQFHRNVHRLLKPDGVAAHFFPTLWTLPFVLNRVVPDRLTGRLLLALQPFRSSHGMTGKFPAYYRWCRGPTRRQLRRLRRLGYRIEQYTGFFGHGYYVPMGIRNTRPLETLETWKTRLLLRHPIPSLTAYAFVVLRKG